MLFANLLIGLREGLEASMVVMILVAFLTKSDRHKDLRYVWIGVTGALAITVATFSIIHYGTKTLTTQGQELIGGIGSLVAVALISYILLWMRGASKNFAADLNSRMAHAVTIGPLAVVSLAFVAVAREGIETALLVFDTFAYGSTAIPAMGLSAGVAIAIVLTVAMYRGALRINLSVFFRITGALLIVVAAGILRYGITDLQEAGALPGLQSIAFDISGVLVPGTTFAAIMEGIFNVVPTPTTASFVAWAAYLVIALPAFLLPGRKKSTAKNAKTTSTGANATDASATGASSDLSQPAPQGAATTSKETSSL